MSSDSVSILSKIECGFTPLFSRGTRRSGVHECGLKVGCYIKPSYMPSKNGAWIAYYYTYLCLQ